MNIRKLCLVTAVTVSTLLSAQSVSAKVCTVNIEKTYKAAEQNGWNFWCSNKAALTFDNQKRVGCSGKAPYGASNKVLYYGHFFQRNINQTKNTHLRGGWKVHSYKVTGGQYNKNNSDIRTAVSFKFYANAGSRFKRHLSELKLYKKNGNCSKAINEAF